MLAPGWGRFLQMSAAIQRDEVDVAMEAWVRWARNVFPGWPNVSLLGRIIKYGVRGAAQLSGIQIEEVDELCELVDRALMRLTERERECIIEHYRRWETYEVSAKRIGISQESFRNAIHRARRRISDFLEGHRLALQTFEGVI